MNNLLYVFVFLLISMAVTSMLSTNKNVEQVQLDRLSAGVLFANEKNILSVSLHNKNPRASLWDIAIKVRSTDDIPNQIISQIKPFSTETIGVEWTPEKRGMTMLPRLHVQSRFPFRLLVAWKYFTKEQQVIVYPERKGNVNLPQLSGASAQEQALALLDKSGFFRDYREFERTDSPSRIAWKKSLKIQKHLVKNFENSGDKKVLIDWGFTKNLNDFEQRISQMALWVQVCHDSHSSYSLKLKKTQTPFANGLNHYKQCLHELALLQLSDVT